MLWCALFLAVEILPAYGESPSLSKNREEALGDLDQDVRRTELQTALQKQMNALSDAEYERKILQDRILENEKKLEEAEVNLRPMERTSPTHLNLYYQQAKTQPLTQSGHFYDEAVMERDEWKKHLLEGQKELILAENRCEEEQRKLEAAKLQLQNYDQALEEGWLHNPF